MRRERRRSGIHCPQFVACKQPAILADPGLGEYRVAWTLNANSDDDRQKHWPKKPKEQGASNKI
jgi:hypothetical protein